MTGTVPEIKYFENNNLLTVNSGTSALHLSLILANVGPGDEVIVAFAKLQEQTDKQTLKDVIWWYENAYGFKTKFKADMVAK